MRNLVKQIITFAIVALLCDFIACISAERRSLRLSGLSQQRNLSSKSKSSKSKSSKSMKKSSKSYGDDDDDGKGKGSKSMKKSSKSYGDDDDDGKGKGSKRKLKSSKSMKKSSKSYGDDDDDGKGKGSKSMKKSSKSYGDDDDDDGKGKGSKRKLKSSKSMKKSSKRYGDDDDDGKGKGSKKKSKSSKSKGSKSYGDDDDDGKGSKKSKSSKNKGSKSYGDDDDDGKGSKKSKSSKSKGSKSYGDDDDDGKGKGAKKNSKSSKSYESSESSDDSSSESSSSDSESTSGRIGEPDRKDHSDEDKDPADDFQEIGDNVRAIVPDKKPSTDFAVATVDTPEDEDSENESMESPNFEQIEKSDYSFVVETDNKDDQVDLRNETNESPSDETVRSSESSIEMNENQKAEETDSTNEIAGSSESSIEMNENESAEETDSTNTLVIVNPNNEPIQSDGFSVVQIVDTVSIPSKEATESPTVVTTEETSDILEVYTHPKFEKETRTVQIMHPGAENECMTFDFLLEEMAIYMAECSTWKTRKDDYWEILRLKEEGDRFQLRHKSTRKCIPMNSENPELPFNCIQFFGMGEAIADSFKGLVNCYSDHAAEFEIDESSNSLYMSNSGCEDDSFIDPIPVFMTYNTEELTGGRNTVVWGGKALLELQEGVQDYNFNSQWKFVDVIQTSTNGSFPSH